MDDAKVVVGKPRSPGESQSGSDQAAAWRIIGPIGLAFLAVGLADLILIWYPIRLGTPEWEFGTIGTTLNNLPLVTLGLMLVGAWAVRTGRVGPARAFGALALSLGVVLVLMVFMYLLTLPPAWRALQSVEDPSALQLARKGIVKTLVQAIAYPLGFLVVGWRAWASAVRV